MLFLTIIALNRAFITMKPASYPSGCYNICQGNALLPPHPSLAFMRISNALVEPFAPFPLPFECAIGA